MKKIHWTSIGVGLIAVGLLLFLLAGCDARAQRTAPQTSNEAAVAQAVADSQAGLDAFAKAPGVTYDANAAKILEGAKEYDLAAAGKTTLPQPHMTPEAILSNPDGYHSAAVEAREKADGTWWKVVGASVLGLLAPAAIAALRFIPGVGAVAAPIAEGLANVHWFTLASADQKAADEKVAMVAGHAQSIASAVDSAVPGWRDKLPPSAVASINAVLGKS